MRDLALHKKIVLVLPFIVALFAACGEPTPPAASPDQKAASDAAAPGAESTDADGGTSPKPWSRSHPSPN